MPFPEAIIDPPWLESRRQAQLETEFDVFCDFAFSDQLEDSAIRFRNKITADSGKDYRPNHYDHGNGIAIADVAGDGLYDIYFVTEVGDNELWRNLGGGKFEDITQRAGVSLYPLYFGLGDAEVVDQITVRWPSGREQIVSGPIATNSLVEVREL